MKLYNNLYISENNQQNIEKLSKDKNIEQKYRKKMAHSLKYLVNPTHKILKIKILLFGCLPMKIVQMLSMVH